MLENLFLLSCNLMNAVRKRHQMMFFHDKMEKKTHQLGVAWADKEKIIHNENGFTLQVQTTCSGFKNTSQKFNEEKAVECCQVLEAIILFTSE